MTTLTVGELRELIDGLDDSVEVRLATQPRYPFSHACAGLNHVSPHSDEIASIRSVLEDPESTLTTEERAEGRTRLAELEAHPGVLYVLEGGDQQYASVDLWSI